MKDWPKRVIISLIRGYAWLVSPFLGAGKCRFHPTCSTYAVQAVARFGVVRGGWMGVKRILSCHAYSRRPFHDPVPEAIKPGQPITHTQTTDE